MPALPEQTDPRAQTKPRIDADQRILALAARQHGVVTRVQLLSAGVAAHAIDYRLEKRRLETVYRGVYRLGPVRSPHEVPMAAVLFCGSTALLSHRSAAALWDLTAEAAMECVHVSIESGRRASAAGLRIHRVSALRDEEKACRHDLPLTSVARTLLDMAAEIQEHALERMIALAERGQLITATDLTALMALRPHHRGVARLRRVVGNAAEVALTRSEAEARFLALIRAADLKTPAANVRVQGWEVDFLWRAERLVVEIDGFAFHSSAAAFERDRRRDATLIAAGLKVMRVTWRQLVDQPHAVVARLAQALARASAV